MTSLHEQPQQNQSIRITIPLALIQKFTFTPWQITMISWNFLSSCHSTHFEPREQNRKSQGLSFTDHALHGWSFLEEAMRKRDLQPLLSKYEKETRELVPEVGNWSFDIPKHIAYEVLTGDKFREINPIIQKYASEAVQLFLTALNEWDSDWFHFSPKDRSDQRKFFEEQERISADLYHSLGDLFK